MNSMMPRISPARRAALEILDKINRNQGNSDALLHGRAAIALSLADRNLCTTLVMGVLRWQRVLDAQFRAFLARPNQAVPAEALLALRLGAYQLLFLDRIPVHAAIFESVEWMKQSNASHQAGMVNAVLRKVAALPKPLKTSAETAYPAWMVTRWQQAYGMDAARRICEAGQQEPQTAVRLLTPQAEAALSKLAPGNLLAAARRGKISEEELPPGAQFQDESSQLVAELLGRGSRILDCCAAPGGKTAILAGNNPGAKIVACDVQPARLQAMQRRLSRSLPQAQIEYRVADAAGLNNTEQFDRILCDVPCSGTGTLGRNPEIRHRLKPEDLARQAARQREILTTAFRLLAPGGRLIYSTCSLEPEENEHEMDAVLRQLEQPLALRRVDLREEFDQLQQRSIVQGTEAAHLRDTGFRNGVLRTLPGLHSGDGFFAAMIERGKE